MKPWYRINALAGSAAEILIYEQIGENFWGDGLTAKRFVDDLQALGPVDTLKIRINSPGGDVFAGNAIYNALRGHRARKEVYIDGVAASIASVIAMAGDTVTMPENAMLFIHDPWSYAMGSAEDMRKAADMLDKTKEGLISAYAAKTSLPREEIAATMSADTWMTAAEAVAAGYADVVDAPVKIEARFDLLRQYRNAPQALLRTAAVAAPVAAEPTPNREDTMTKDELRKKYPEACQEIFDDGKAAGKEAGAETIAQAKLEGAAAERQRIQAVQAQAMPGHEKLVVALMFDGTTSGPEAAVQVLAAERQLRGAAAAAMNADAVGPVAEPAAPAVATTAASASAELPVEERAKKAWNDDVKVRNEFGGDYEAFAAWFEANAAGCIKVLGR